VVRVFIGSNDHCLATKYLKDVAGMLPQYCLNCESCGMHARRCRSRKVEEQAGLQEEVQRPIEDLQELLRALAAKGDRSQ
jgi:hypothetical protein